MPKVPKAVALLIVLLDNVPSGITLKEVDLTNKGRPAGIMVIKPENVVFIKNITDDPLIFNAGAVLAGFGRGIWKLQGKDKDIDENTMLLYKLDGPDTHVIFNTSNYQSVMSIVKARRSKQPLCKIQYHTMTDAVGATPGSFSLVLEHSVYFAPAPVTVDSEQLQQGSVAATLPCHVWANTVTSITWTVKWNAQGLGPVRPLVVFSTEVILPPKHALLISK